MDSLPVEPPEGVPSWSVFPHRGYEDCWGCGMPPTLSWDDPMGPPRQFCEWCAELLAATSPRIWGRIVRYGDGISTLPPVPTMPDPGIPERR